MSGTISSLVTYGETIFSSLVITDTGAIETSAAAAVSNNTSFATITSAGTLSGGEFGVSLGNGGLIANEASGEILGVVGVDISGAAFIDNNGLINGIAYGVILGVAALTNGVSGRISGGAELNSGTILNEGTIARAEGAIVNFADGGTVLNLGSAAALTGGAVVGVDISNQAGSVVNEGAISGILLGSGGTVTNSGYISTGLLSVGVAISLASGEIVNAGHIVGAALYNGGNVLNASDGTISGYADGIILAAGGYVKNAGQILGIGGRFSALAPGDTGLSMTGSGTIINSAGAVIEGSNNGIVLAGTGTAVTITNEGTIIGKKGIVVEGHGAATIFDYGTIEGTGGTAIFFADGNDTLVLEPGGVVDGIIVGGDPSAETTLTIDGTVASNSGDIQLAAGGNLVIGAVFAAAETISFAGTDATLMIGDARAFTSEIAGMSLNDTIDLASVPFNVDASLSLTTSNVLQVFSDGQTYDLRLDPLKYYPPQFFHISSNGLNGTDISESAVPCFLRNTWIATDGGSVRVQNLKIGEFVAAGSGVRRQVKWIGRRRYVKPLPDDPDVVPVLIKVGAIAPETPNTDLYISPRHAVRVGEYLVPAGALINDVSILSCTGMSEIDYFHVELESADTVFANGVEAETFIDQDSRKMFDNADEFYQLYPEGGSADFAFGLPRLESGAGLDAARRKIALRAGVLLDQTADENVVGFVEEVDRQHITGWAFAPGRPNVPVILDIFNRGVLLGRTIANIPRPDVKDAGFGHGRCGFAVHLPGPLPALMRHEIVVRPVDGAAALAGCPVVIDPGLAQELLATGSLKTLIDAAVQGLGSERDALAFGQTLEAAGRRIRLAAHARPAGARGPNANQPVALVIDENWPTVARDAGSNAVVSHVEALLSLGYRVAFCAASGPPNDGAAAAGLDALQERGVFCHGQDGTSVEMVIRSGGATRLDVIYLHRLAMATAYAGMVRQYTSAKLIYAVADLHHLRLARQAQITSRPDLALKARSVKAAEFWAMRLADCVITHSRFEADYLRREAPCANVHVVPWAVNVSAGRGAVRNRHDVAFVGGADHAPNRDAVSHLARDIMPAVWQKAPDMRCLVIGSGWGSNFFAQFDDRLVNLGQVQDLAPRLRTVRLTVAPLRFGAGLKGKVLESMAAGTPCVMSNVAAEGFPLDVHLRRSVGDGALFADNVLTIYQDRKVHRILTQSGQDMVATAFSKDAVAHAMARALGNVRPSARDEGNKASVSPGRLVNVFGKRPEVNA